MKTPTQEVYENFNLMSDADFKAWMLNTDLLKIERDVMVDFAYKFGDEPLSEIPKWYDKQFKTKKR